MPGASAASAPSIRLSHFLFAHLFHGFILAFSLAFLLAASALYARLQLALPSVLEKNLSGAHVLFLETKWI